MVQIYPEAFGRTNATSAPGMAQTFAAVKRPNIGNLEHLHSSMACGMRCDTQKKNERARATKGIDVTWAWENLDFPVAVHAVLITPNKTPVGADMYIMLDVQSVHM